MEKEDLYSPQRERLATSITFGDDFVQMLEQQEDIFPTLSEEAQERIRRAKEPVEIRGKPKPPIYLDTPQEAACLLRLIPHWRLPYLIGGKVGKENIMTGQKVETADQIVLQMMSALGLWEDKPNIGKLAGRLAGQEKNTIILIIGFGGLPQSEQKKLQNLLGKNRILKKVPQIYVH